MPAELARTETERPGSGEHQASFEERLRPLLAPAFRLARSMLQDREEAEDAVQEAALSAWRKLDQFTDRGSGLGPWFLAIVANKCRERLRSRWWQVWRRAEIDPGTARPHEDSVIFRTDLARVLGRLTAQQRAVLLLRYGLDLPQEEVAAVLGMRVGSVKSTLHRAVLRIRELMEEKGHGA